MSGIDGWEGPSTQSFREQAPAPPLRQYLTCLWVQQVPASSPAYPHRAAPNGSAELVWQLGSESLIVVGPQTGPTEQFRAPGTTIIGLRLRPGILRSVLGVPGCDLVDQTVDLAEIWGVRGLELAEAIADSGSATEAISVLQARLLTVLANPSTIDVAVLEAVRRLLHDPTVKVGDLAASIGLSDRQLRRRCEAGTGIAPKPLHRMLRLQRFLALTRRYGPRASLALLSAQAGFADQAHLTRECQRLTGRSPATALRESEHNCDGVHDHGASDASLLRPIPSNGHGPAVAGHRGVVQI